MKDREGEEGLLEGGYKAELKVIGKRYGMLE